MSDENQRYWASETEPLRFIARTKDRLATHLTLLQRSGRLSNMIRMLSAYYGHGTDGARDSGALQTAGEDGEVVAMHINAVKPIINNTLSLIAGQEPAVKPKPRNEDARALAQARLADSLREAFEGATSSKEAEIDVVRGGLLASSWTLGQAWRPREGKEWAIGPNGPIYEGDADIFVLPPWRVVYDFAAPEASKRKWGFFRQPQSRWDIAAHLEEQGNASADPLEKEKLLEAARKLRVAGGGAGEPTSLLSKLWASVSQTLGSSVTMLQGLDALLGETLPEEDVVWVWELRHLPSPALPQGRLVRWVDPDIVLFDTLALGKGYPYHEKDLHLYEYSPERTVTASGGHTGAFDLGAMQEFLDVCHASISNTVNILGQMQIWQQGDEAPVVRQLSTGNSVLTGKTKPELLNWPAVKGEVVQAAEYVLSRAREAMALNDVVMGQPDKGMPASAQALQRAQAMQFHAVAQAERVRLRARNVNGLLRMLKRFADSPRETALVGKARAYELREWKSEDIEDVELFDVEAVNPMSATFEGRQSLLELLMKLGVIKEPDALLTFVQTGSLGSVTSTQTMQRELVEANVSLLQDGVGPPPVDPVASLDQGQPVFVPPPDGAKALIILKSDPHHLAIPAYLGVLASPTSRENPAIVKAATEAIQLSLQYWQMLTPDEAMCFGIPPLASQLMMAGMPPGAPQPGGDGEPPSGPKAGDGIEEAKLPAPPEDPLTGDHEDAGATGLTQ